MGEPAGDRTVDRPGDPRVNPWAVPPPAPAPARARLGPAQGAILMIGFLVIQPAVAAIAFVLRGAAISLRAGSLRAGTLRAGGSFHAFAPPAPSGQFIAATAIIAYALAASWAWGYAMRRAGARLREGGPEGIGWCRPLRGGYAAAVLGAGLATGAAALLFRLFPPPTHLAANSPLELMLQPGPLLVPAILLVTLLAPVAEEFVFRGAAFAAFAGRWGAGIATVIVTVLFVAVHAPEKWVYPPGFLDVTLMALGACWVRLRFRSLRPAMVLHVLYNIGVIAVAAMVR